MTTFITGKTGLSNYLCIPRPVLRLALNGTELHLYALLLDRARLSQRKPDWMDREGRVFIFYPIAQLAADLGKAEMTVKRGLNRLEAQGLLYRKRQGACRANKLYVRVPLEEATPAAASAPACGKNCGKTEEKEAFDRLLRQKRREWETASPGVTAQPPRYAGTGGSL